MQFFICSVLYFLGFLVFGWYIHLVEWTDMFSCFLFKYINPVNGVYDYIIVGAGTAGSVVALRLTENGNDSVLVIEAGPRSGYFMDIPAIAPMMQLSTVDWQYRTAPQKYACGALKNNVSFWPMGRIVGGTSMLNNLIYTRGHRSDFEDWYRDLSGFSYDQDILPYFKKLQDYRASYEFDDKYQSKSGPLPVDDIKFPTDLLGIFLESIRSLRYPIRNLNGRYNTGFMPVQVNLKHGKRWTTGHVLTDSKLPNLHLLTNAYVEKLLFKSNYEAHAVKYTHLGETYAVKARKGIILSAGVIGSPKILMLSGIGPKNHLAELGLAPKINLPVGDNLQDHVGTGYDLVTFNKSFGFDFIDMCSPLSICNYFFKSQGAWTMGGAEVLGILNTNNLNQPDLEVMVLPMGVSFESGKQILKSTNLKSDVYRSYFEPLVGKTVVTLLPVVLHPKSRGTIRLKDKNPKSKPVIDPNYLSDPYDVQILLKGIDLIKKIVRTEPMRKMGATIYNKPFPGCERLEFDSGAYWECYVRHLTLSVFHPVGTCKMGRLQDKTSVVNYDFQVHGTNKLYVVDGSVLPTLPSANPNAAIIMLAEKLADTIKYHNYLNTGFCENVFTSETKCSLTR